QLFLDLMFRTDLPQKPIVVFDDIRLMNMLRIWRNISLPKLDVTSFGHWSGTGLVDWQP
ncbi:MAG: methyltransferase, partial [Deltaproteobacteria bacterium]|nr:methyltransferase [Deltaproteobacteria bacterium]